MSGFEIRRATDADRPAVLDLLARSLGWLPDDHHAAFFAWKHESSPFGPSLAWVAEDAGQVIGFRTFLRWEFRIDGATRRAVRAVDTATHPDHRGRGIFSALTLHALSELPAEGIDFVFNTPNDQSRPGYLKMGWQEVGRLPVRVRPRSVGAAARLVRARTAADLWSTPTESGLAAEEALADTDAVRRLLDSQPPSGHLTTNRSVEHLRWRYAGFPPLRYRATMRGSGAETGIALWRLRRRGPAVEAALVDVLAPHGDPAVATRLARDAARESGADYAIGLGGLRPGRGRFLPLPRQGPLLVWRGVHAQDHPARDEWALSLGDVELF